MQVKKNTTVMKTRYINQSPYNKVLWWAIFIKHNLKFELSWAGLGMLGCLEFMHFFYMFLPQKAKMIL